MTSHRFQKGLAILARLWLNTLRLSWDGAPAPAANALMALWHEHLPVCMRAFKNGGHAVLISRSRDGEIAANICQPWGYHVFRGSSSTGGAQGLKQMVRHLQRPQGPALAGMALDGPHGPAHNIQPGAGWLSEKLRLPLYPVHILAPHAFRLRTWDRTIIPLPFSLVHVYVGKPFPPKNRRQISEAMKKMELGEGP